MGLDLIDMDVFISWHWIRQKCNNFWSRNEFINKDGQQEKRYFDFG